MLVVDLDGRTEGSILGGAMNQQVVTAARQLLDSTRRCTALTIDVDTVDATAAGLACGGAVEVLIHRLEVVPNALWEALAAGRPVALVTAIDADGAPLVVLRGGETVGSLGDPELDTRVRVEAESMWAHPGLGLARLAVGPVELVIESWRPVPTLVISGMSELSVALTRQVQLLGWTSSITSGVAEGLAAVEALGPADVVIVIDHDPLVATPVLAAALRRDIAYVGALGSRRTQASRRSHLADAGLGPNEIDRLHGPTGLDIGAHNPSESAVSIVAEVIAVRSGRSGTTLKGSTGRISG